MLDLSVWQGIESGNGKKICRAIAQLVFSVGRLISCAHLSDPFNAAKSALFAFLRSPLTEQQRFR
jgi:DMSO reductase anchor subunit